MSQYDYFISHHHSSKELARLFYYNGVYNGLAPWYDESLLSVGDILKDKIRQGINQSNGYLLIYSKRASESDWIKFEMKIAKDRKKSNPDFKILVLRIDSTPINSFFLRYKYEGWKKSNEINSILNIIKALTGKDTISIITAASVLSAMPSRLFRNKTRTMTEHSRNYLLLHLAHIKTLITSLSQSRFESDLKDSLNKLNRLFIFESVPSLAMGGIPIGQGIFEFIHSNRMRIPPRININIEVEYGFKIINNDEISTRIRFFNKKTGKEINYPIPFSIEFDAEL